MPIEKRTHNGKTYWVDSTTDDVLSEVNEKVAPAPEAKKAITIAPDAKIGSDIQTPLAPLAAEELRREATGQISSGSGNFMRNFAINSLPAIGGIGGSIVGGVPGSLLGTSIGTVLQRGANSAVGNPITDPENHLTGLAKDIGLNVASDLVGNVAGTAAGQVFNAGKKAVMLGTNAGRTKLATQIAANSIRKGTALSPETLQYIESHPDFPVTLGQIKGKQSGWAAAEDLLAGEGKNVLEGQQQAQLTGDLESFIKLKQPVTVKMKKVHGKINERNTNYHATSGDKVWSILEDGIDPSKGVQAEGTTSVSRIPGINLERYNGVSFEMRPQEGFKPIQEVGYEKGTGKPFEYENRGSEKIGPEQIQRVLINKESIKAGPAGTAKDPSGVPYAKIYENEKMAPKSGETKPSLGKLLDDHKGIQFSIDNLKYQWYTKGQGGKVDDLYKDWKQSDFLTKLNGLEAEQQKIRDAVSNLDPRNHPSYNEWFRDRYISDLTKKLDEKGIPYKILDSRDELRKVRVTPQAVNVPEENALLAKENLSGGYEKRRQAEKRTWEQTIGIADGYRVKIPGKITEAPSKVLDASGNPVMMKQQAPPETIAGPITITKSKEFANEVLDDIKKHYNVESTEDLLKITTEQEKAPIAILKLMADSEKPIPMKVLTDLIRVMGDKGFNGAGTIGTVKQGLFQKLRSTLREDGVDSIKNWNYALKEETLKYWEKANFRTARKHQIFGKDVPEVSNLMDTKYSGKQELADLLRDPASIQNAIRGSKDRLGMRKTLTGEYFSDILERTSKDGHFNSMSDALDVMTSRTDHGQVRALLTPTDISRMRQLFSVIKETPSTINTAGTRNLAIREVQGGVSLAGGFLEALRKGEFGPLVGSGSRVVGTIIGAKAFVNRIAMNPEVTRAAIALAKLPPESTKSKALQRVVWGALRGSQITVQSQNEQGQLSEKNVTLAPPDK